MKNLPSNLYTKCIEQHHNALNKWNKLAAEDYTLYMTSEGNMIARNAVHSDLISHKETFRASSRNEVHERYIQLPQKGERAVYSLRIGRELEAIQELCRNFICERELERLAIFFEKHLSGEWVLLPEEMERKRIAEQAKREKLAKLRKEVKLKELAEDLAKVKAREEQLKSREKLEYPTFDDDFGVESFGL